MSLRVRFARTPWSRTFGLLGRRSFPVDSALVFERCAAVHTGFMRMPIDVVFFDERYQVIALYEAVKAWRYIHHKGAFGVAEFAAGGARRAGLSAGAVFTPT